MKVITNSVNTLNVNNLIKQTMKDKNECGFQSFSKEQLSNWGKINATENFKLRNTPEAKKKVNTTLKEHGISIVNNGSLFTIGAGGYIVLNVINGLSQNESVTSSKNLTNLGIAAAVFVFDVFAFRIAEYSGY